MADAFRSESDALERVPRWAIGELEIAHIGAEAQAQTRAYRDDGDVVGNERGHAEPADEISGPIDAAETLEDRVGAGQVINQHHRARAVRAGIKADARSLPEYAQIPGVLGVERAVAITQAADKGSAGFLAENIAVRQSPLADRLLDDHSEAAGNAAEKSMPGIDQFVRGELVGGRKLRRRGRGRDGGRRLGRNRLRSHETRDQQYGKRCQDRDSGQRSRRTSEFHKEAPPLTLTYADRACALPALTLLSPARPKAHRRESAVFAATMTAARRKRKDLRGRLLRRMPPGAVQAAARPSAEAWRAFARAVLTAPLARRER